MDDVRITDLLLREFPDLVAIYRFGSTVSGETHAESDLDVAVLPARPLAPERIFDVSGALEASEGRRVDLVDLLAAPTVLRHQVVTTGRAITVVNEDVRAEFENRTYSQYARLNEERGAIVERVVRERSVYGG